MSKGNEISGLFETIIELFAVTVLLDDQQRDQELIEFTHASLVNNQYLRPDEIVCRERIVLWFEENQDRIKRRLGNSDSEAYLSSLLKKVEDEELQKRVLSSIFVIAVCDDQLDDIECDFIKLALETWGIDHPDGKDLELVA